MDRWRAPGPIGALARTVAAASLVLGAGLALAVPIAHRLVDRGVAVEWPRPSLRALALRSVVYDRAGRTIGTLSGPEERAYTPMRRISPVLQRAVLAAEDRDFYEHGGVDWRGVSRAITKNLDAGAATQGGSTITQQLVKNTMFTGAKRDLSRKIKEATLAVGLERRYSKREIFEQYLNTVYFGNGAYGVRAAAERYFDRSPGSLSLGQSALLAALIANPSARDPIRHPDEASRWRDHVLDEMASAGFASRPAADRAQAEPLPTTLHFSEPDQLAVPFIDEVKRQLLDDPRMGATYEERYRMLFEGGVRIHTTFDPGLQAVATFVGATALPPSPYTVSMAVVDNASGAVRAIVPGGSFRSAGFDLATQGRRQTGSAFKAITVAAALESGFSPDDLVNASGRCTLRFDRHAPPWDLENYEGQSFGTVTFAEALARSSNCAFARIAMAVGPQRIVDMAHRLGISGPLPAVPSITLGTADVSPLDMAKAFSVLAADGLRHATRFVDRVEKPDGRLVLQNADETTRVLDPEVARTATDMLVRVVRDGTARRTLGDFPRPAAGKTGTNDESRDVWFVGYTAQLTAAVWIGKPEAPSPVVIAGARQVGGNYPAQIWRRFMATALEGEPVVGFAAPDRARWPPGGYISESGRRTRPPPLPVPAPPPSPRGEQREEARVERPDEPAQPREPSRGRGRPPPSRRRE
jgi:penicillin-binding protein 1A